MKTYPRFLTPKSPKFRSEGIRFLRIEVDGFAYYIFHDGRKTQSGFREEYWETIIKKGNIFEITEAEAALL